MAILGPLSAHAQPAKAPTLGEILQRLEDNLTRYDTKLPSLFCEEHVVSQVAPGRPDENTTTDSIFRLKRTARPDQTTTLVESREIKTVDSKPPASQEMGGPTMLTGAFESGLAVVSLSQAGCMNYTLERIDPKKRAAPYVVRFATALTPQNSAGCLLQEKSKGRVVIDPATLQIRRLELTTPHHIIIPATHYRSPVIGERVITVDYSPVPLGSETFSLPATITQRVTSGSGTFHTTVWSFQATYRNYHMLEVSSRILP